MRPRALLPPSLDKSGMTSTETSTYLSAVKWGEEGHYLKEFTGKLKLPQVAKIIKGQYQNLGVPSLPSPNLSQVVFVSSAGTKLKVIAQCVKFKDAGRRMVPVGAKLAIPDNFDGWFEILSEDGKAVRCIESVAELARRNPKSCLVRDSIKVHLPRPDDVDSVWDKTRTISPGEILTVGEILSGVSSRSSRGSGKYLGCATSFGDTVYLPLELRGRFSTIAGEDNISGVHTVKTLLSKRFPLMVRLVHGKPPVGVKTGSQFVPEMRLYSLVEEECLVAMPLSKDSGVVALPSNAALKVLAPKNAEVLSKMPEHASLVNKCHSLMVEVSGCIQVCDVNSVREIKQAPPSPQYVYTRRQTTYRTVPLVKRSASDPQGTNLTGRTHLDRGMSTPNDSSLPNAGEDYSDSDDVRYDEIDQIYDYVRGFAPLPVNIKNEFSVTEEHKSQLLPQISLEGGVTNGGKSKPPEPPPIETIPVRKSSTGTVKNSQATPQKITVNIVNRTPSLKTKEIYFPHRSQKWRKSSDDHIYEKIDKRKNNGLKLVKVFETPNRTPLRSNSASKVFLNANCDSNNNTSNVKGLHHKRQGQFQFHLSPNQATNNANNNKSRFLKNKNGHAHKDLSSRNNKSVKSSWVNSGVKTIATSPLFHIRYKSLTDLLMDTKKSSPESSNTSSGKKMMNGSAGSSSTVSSKDDIDLPDDHSDILDNPPKNAKNSRRLSRPKSLSNLIGDVSPKKRLDNHNYYNLVQNDLIKPPPELNCPKFYSMPDSGSRHVKNHFAGSNHHSRKLGTLYL